MIKNIIYFIFGIIFLNILRLSFVSDELFKLLVVLVLFLIFNSSLSYIECKKKTQFTDCFLCILIISFIYFIVSVITGNLFFSDIKLLFFIMGISIFILPSLKIIKDCLGEKKSRLIDICLYISLFISIMVAIILHSVLNLNINIVGIIILLSMYVVFIPVILLNRKLVNFNKIKFDNIKKIIFNNIRPSILKLSNVIYYYLSLLFLYFCLINVYMYYDKSVTKNLVDVYLYYFFIVSFISYVYLSKKNDRKTNIVCIDIIDNMLPKLLVLSFLASPILLILFGSSFSSFIFSLLIFESLFIVLYNIIYKRLLDNNSRFNIVIILGIVIKCIIIIPLINWLYKIGLGMIYGDIISTFISLFVVIIIGIFNLNKIEKIKFDISRLFKIL